MREIRPFPPPTITNWVNYRGVSTDRLIEELRYWAEAFESLLGLEAAAQRDGSETVHDNVS